MKKHLFFGILLLLVSGINAGEPMFLPDTEWHYYESDLFSNTSNKRTYTIQDSQIDMDLRRFTMDMEILK